MLTCAAAAEHCSTPGTSLFIVPFLMYLPVLLSFQVLLSFFPMLLVLVSICLRRLCVCSGVFVSLSCQCCANLGHTPSEAWWGVYWAASTPLLHCYSPRELATAIAAAGKLQQVSNQSGFILSQCRWPKYAASMHSTWQQASRSNQWGRSCYVRTVYGISSAVPFRAMTCRPLSIHASRSWLPTHPPTLSIACFMSTPVDQFTSRSDTRPGWDG